MNSDIHLGAPPTLDRNVFTVREDGSTTLVWNGQEKSSMLEIDALHGRIANIVGRVFGTDQNDPLMANLAFLARDKVVSVDEVDPRFITILRTDLYHPEQDYVIEHRVAIVYQENGEHTMIVRVGSTDPANLIRKLKQKVDMAVNEIISSEEENKKTVDPFRYL
ncbi:hypothetical protein P280DRAFT_464339 [Massarina eburnea CBS 473.64]|uniref:Uncharacterized protein n=1 Tax=Massarina eburnea CBS 473.64 TaxID=1395130 RepID=A0A6A6SIL8_9PLEO|nr:hypothetical protein P280DRAFT_464339 [Massarina eburnea CBS 473.64]